MKLKRWIALLCMMPCGLFARTTLVDAWSEKSGDGPAEPSARQTQKAAQVDQWVDEFPPYFQLGPIFGAPKSDGQTMNWKLGFDLEAGIRAWDDFRGALEFTYIPLKRGGLSGDKDNKTYKNIQADGSMWVFMANAYYDYPIEHDFEIYAGAGLGFCHASAEGKADGTKIRDYDKSGIGLQGIFGGTFLLTDNWALYANARYMYVFTKTGLFNIGFGGRYSF